MSLALWPVGKLKFGNTRIIDCDLIDARWPAGKLNFDKVLIIDSEVITDMQNTIDKLKRVSADAQDALPDTLLDEDESNMVCDTCSPRSDSDDTSSCTTTEPEYSDNDANEKASAVKPRVAEAKVEPKEIEVKAELKDEIQEQGDADSDSILEGFGDGPVDRAIEGWVRRETHTMWDKSGPTIADICWLKVQRDKLLMPPPRVTDRSWVPAYRRRQRC